MIEIDFFAHDPDEVVEPWRPKVGDRVRTIDAECGLAQHFRPAETIVGHKLSDVEREDLFKVGRYGEIISIMDVNDGHPYVVWLFVPVLGIRRWRYAAVELEPA